MIKINITVTIMKTQLNQILTITTFFSLAITTTLAISWGVSDVLLENEACKENQLNTLIIQQAKKSFDLNKSLQLLIPKLR